MRTSISDITINPDDDPLVVLEHPLLQMAMETYAGLLADDDKLVRKQAAKDIVDIYGRNKSVLGPSAALPPGAGALTLQQFNFNPAAIGDAASGMLKLLERAAAQSLGGSPSEPPLSKDPTDAH